MVTVPPAPSEALGTAAPGHLPGTQPSAGGRSAAFDRQARLANGSCWHRRHQLVGVRGAVTRILSASNVWFYGPKFFP